MSKKFYKVSIEVKRIEGESYEDVVSSIRNAISAIGYECDVGIGEEDEDGYENEQKL